MRYLETIRIPHGRQGWILYTSLSLFFLFLFFFEGVIIYVVLFFSHQAQAFFYLAYLLALIINGHN